MSSISLSEGEFLEIGFSGCDVEQDTSDLKIVKNLMDSTQICFANSEPIQRIENDPRCIKFGLADKSLLLSMCFSFEYLVTSQQNILVTKIIK